MTNKVTSFHSLMDEMRAVAKGKKPAPKDAGKTSFNSAEAVDIGARGVASHRVAKDEKENPDL